MVAPRGEKAYERHAWLVFFVFGLLAVISSPIGLLGMPPNPPSPVITTGLSLDEMAARIPGILDYIGGISRQLGNFMLATGVMLTGIAAVPYRKGERWAWYVAWILPVVLIIQIANSLPTGGYLVELDLAFLPVALAGLFLPYRKFFPKQQAGS